ncbi:MULTISPECIES: helix-turn-helix domain-containing protein [unclassified Streptococcus]|uniref:helix-turn-helix domain-containing protein n=1 Tax=unclassified Streptococcus TaxID=2608887 RepID=UPI00359E4E54
MTIFSEQLKQARKAKNLSQEDLGNQLFLSRQSISKWEKGDATPDLDNLVKLASILDLSLDELVLGKAPEVKIERIVEKSASTWTVKKVIILYWIIIGNLLLTLLLYILLAIFKIIPSTYY